MYSRLSISADVKNLPVLRHFIEETGARLEANHEAIECLIQAVDEAVTNIIIHGYRGGPGNIAIQMDREENALIVSLRDQAPHFDPTQIPHSDLTESLEHRQSGGMGMHLIRHFTDKVAYQVTPEGSNELTLWKKV